MGGLGLYRYRKTAHTQHVRESTTYITGNALIMPTAPHVLFEAHEVHYTITIPFRKGFQ